MPLRFVTNVRKPVPETPDGKDEPWIGGVFLYLCSKSADMHVDGPGFNEGFITPYVIEQLIARIKPAGVGRQKSEKFELRGAQLDLSASKGYRVVPPVHLEAAVTDDILSILHLLPFRPSKNRFDTGDKLPDTEGFRNVIIGAHLQTQDPVQFVIFRSEHDDGEVLEIGALPYDPAYFHPLNARKHEIEDHQSRLFLLNDLKGSLSIMGPDGGKPFLFKIETDQFNDVSFIVDDEYFIAHRMTCPPPFSFHEKRI